MVRLNSLFTFYLFHLLFGRFGRDAFQEATAISRRKALKSVDWTKFKYMVFDVPNHKGTYEERFRILGMCSRRLFTFSSKNAICLV